MGVQCIIEGCGSSRKNNDGNVIFHQLPSDMTLREKWLKVIKEKAGFRSSFEKIGTYTSVCSKHFEESAYKVPKSEESAYEVTQSTGKRVLNRSACLSKGH